MAVAGFPCAYYMTGAREAKVNPLALGINDLLRTDRLPLPRHRIYDRGMPPPVPPLLSFDSPCRTRFFFLLSFRAIRSGTS